MPQAGQRMPIRATEVHGGKPNCRCVPKPIGLGSKRLAMPNNASSASITTTALMREMLLAGARNSHEAGTGVA